jgi:hypothetical protein
MASQSVVLGSARFKLLLISFPGPILRPLLHTRPVTPRRKLTVPTRNHAGLQLWCPWNVDGGLEKVVFKIEAPIESCRLEWNSIRVEIIARVVSPQSAFGLWCNNDSLLPHLRARASYRLEIAEM